MDPFIDWTKAHRFAVANANAMVPNYELNTPAHNAWLAAYDAAHWIAVHAMLTDYRARNKLNS